MEPNKLENEIREKLGKREIQPSAQAWDRLDAMLSVQESKSQKKSFPWIQIAAGLVLFFSIGYFVFENKSNSNQNSESNSVVENSKEILNKNVVEGVASVDSFNEAINTSSEKLSSKPKENEEKSIQKINDKPSNSISQIALTKKELPQVGVKDEVILKTEDKKELNNVVDNNVVVAEIKKSEEKAKLKINPNALLDQVDGEIQLTFRQKVMKTITKNYKEAKEAVASRNQESSINH